MPKNIVICLDGTSNRLHGEVNTNVVRMFELLDLSNPQRQVGYYDPGVGTFSAPGAWTPLGKALTRWAGLLFGVGLRQNLAEAYSYVMSTYEVGDKLYLFGFSRGAYTTRALCGLLETAGILRTDSHNLVPYLIGDYARQSRDGEEFDWATLARYSRDFGRDLGEGYTNHAVVHFVGLWDTVKAAGTLTRQLRWPYTKQLPHASNIRHAISIDERRKPFRSYPVYRPTPPKHSAQPWHQSREQVWFAGVHSDVGGMFKQGSRLSDIPLKWMAEEAMDKGVLFDRARYEGLPTITEENAIGKIHQTGLGWRLLGRLGTADRTIKSGAKIHASVEARIKAHPKYADKLPDRYVFVDTDWLTYQPFNGAH